MSSSTTATADLFAERLWSTATEMDENASRAVVLDALAEGVPAEQVLLDVIGGVQRRVGVEWAADRLTVAQEHAITAINDRIVAAVAEHSTPPEPRLGRVTVACVDGEWHALPARLLSEVLVLRGFQVEYLGAQVPTPHLITHLHRVGPDAVALSGSIAVRLPAAHATITACQAAGVPVIAGGAAFGPDGRYARLLGADAWAPDARSAADHLAAGRMPSPAGAHQAVDDLPHLVDQEYTMVSRTRADLVATALAGIEARMPELCEDAERWQYTAEDLAHIVDFLGTALYVNDNGLFSEFLGWTLDVRTVRGVPADVLLLGLDLIAEQLRDFTRASDFIARSRAVLTETVPSTPGYEA